MTHTDLVVVDDSCHTHTQTQHSQSHSLGPLHIVTHTQFLADGITHRLAHEHVVRNIFEVGCFLFIL